MRAAIVVVLILGALVFFVAVVLTRTATGRRLETRCAQRVWSSGSR
jgi:hypothetical protein